MMNKHRLLLALALLFFFAAGAQQHFIGLPHVFNTPEDVVAARVNLSQVFRYRTTRDGTKDSTIVQENFYDSLGRLYRSYGSLREILYSYEGNLLSQMVTTQSGQKTTYSYEYSPQWQLISQTVEEQPSGTRTNYFFEYRDGIVNRVLRKQPGDDTPQLFQSYVYKDGRLSNVTEWKKGKVLYREHYEYEDGRKTAFVERNKKRNRRYTEELNEKGQVIHYTSYGTLLPTGKLIREDHPTRTEYFYDANSLLAKRLYTYTHTLTIGITEDIRRKTSSTLSENTITDIYHYFSFQNQQQKGP